MPETTTISDFAYCDMQEGTEFLAREFSPITWNLRVAALFRSADQSSKESAREWYERLETRQQEDACWSCGDYYYMDDMHNHLVRLKELYLRTRPLIDTYAVPVCRYCISNQTRFCDSDCGRLFFRYDGSRYCPTCTVRHRCESCSRRVEVEMKDHGRVCWRCYKSRSVNSWDYRPSSFRFFRMDGEQSQTYYGIENEWNVKKPCPDLLQYINQKKLFYTKMDGSVRNGFEVVSQPHTYLYFKEHRYSYLDLFSHPLVTDKTVVRADNEGICGLHIHVSKSGFYSPLHIWRFCKLMKGWIPRMVSGRKSMYWQPGVSRDFSLEAMPKARNMKGVYLGHHGDGMDRARYRHVNLENPETVEVRIFQATTQMEDLEKNVEFVRLVKEYSSICGLRNDANDMLVYMVDHRKTYKNLYSYLQKRLKGYSDILSTEARLAMRG